MVGNLGFGDSSMHSFIQISSAAMSDNGEWHGCFFPRAPRPTVAANKDFDGFGFRDLDNQKNGVVLSLEFFISANFGSGYRFEFTIDALVSSSNSLHLSGLVYKSKYCTQKWVCTFACTFVYKQMYTPICLGTSPNVAVFPNMK